MAFLSPIFLNNSTLCLIGAFAILVAIAGVAESLSKSFGNIVAGVAAMAAIELVMAGMAGVLLLLSQVDIEDMGLKLLAFAGAFVIAVAALAAFSALSGILGNGARVMLAFGTAIALTGVGMLALAKAFDMIVETLVEDVPKITASADQIFSSITSLLGMVVASVSEVVPLIVGIIVGLLVGIIAQLAVSADAIIVSVVDLLNNIADSLETHADTIGAALGNLLVALLRILWSFLKETALSLLDWFGVQRESVGAWFAKIWQDIKDWFVGAIASIKQWFKDIGEAWRNMWESITDFIDKIDQGITEFVEGIIQWVKDKIDAAVGWISDTWQKIKNFFNPNTKDNEQLYNDAAGVAKNTTNAFAGELDNASSAGGRITTAARRMFKNIVNVGNEVLDINSPSRVFMAMGEYTVEGFAKGIDDNAYLANQATENMGNSAISSMQEAIAEIADYNLADVADPTIRPVLDLSEIQNGARNIGSFFGSNYSVGLAAAMSGTSGAGGASPIFNFNVYASEGQSSEEIANAVMDKINYELRSRGSIWRR